MNQLADLYFQIAFLALFVVHVGYWLAFIKNLFLARIATWAMIFGSFTLVVLLVNDQTALFRMVTIVAITLTAMKSIVLVETYQGNVKLNYFQWLAFSVGWFGMRPTLFEKFSSAPLNDVFPLLLKGLSRVVIGLVLLNISGYFLLNATMNFVLHFLP